MANLIPPKPPRAVSPEIARVFRALRSLPDERYLVWHNMGLSEAEAPEFLLLRRDARASLLKVSTASKRDAQSVIQPGLLKEASPKRPFAEEEQLCLDVWRREALRNSPKTDLPGLIAFPNLKGKDLEEARLAQNNGAAAWLSLDDLRPEGFQAIVEGYLSEELGAEEIHALRSEFTPETQVPSDFTVRQPIDRRTGASLTEYLLDYRQEWLLKSDLDLNEQASRTSRDFSVRLVNGVAGSGKSLIIVYRAKLLRELFPDKRILVLTHNKPLIQDLKARYRILTDGDEGVEWSTFLSWCFSLLPSDMDVERPLGEHRRRALIEEVNKAHLAESAVSPEMLEAEIDWFKDRLLTKRQDYLMADRTGRGFALQETMRERVFDAMQDYQRKLANRGFIDWGDVPRLVWRLMVEGEIADVEYDAILVDEAQFFAPIWFEIIKKVLKSQTGHLFIVADPTQGFLGRGQSWLASGLEVRGRTTRLNKSYRTTREILDFATLLYRNRLPDDDEDIVLPDLANMPTGVVPVVQPISTPQDELHRVVNEVLELVKQGIPNKDILVIHSSWKGVEAIISQLSNELGPEVAVDPKDSGDRDKIRVCTLNAATGLESPIVFLAGLKELHEREQSLRISEEDRLELIRDNTRKLYMAITRAGQRLAIFYAGEVPSWLNGNG